MNTQDHATPPPLVPVLLDDESDDDSIGAPQVSQGEPPGNDGPPDIHISPELPFQQSSQEDSEGAQLEEEAQYGATTGRPIWEHDKKTA